MNAHITSSPRNSIQIDKTSLDLLMPMHLQIDATGHIRSVGPTLAKLRPDTTLIGAKFLDEFDVKRPHNITRFSDLTALKHSTIRVQLHEGRGLNLKGLLVATPNMAPNMASAIHPVDVDVPQDLSPPPEQAFGALVNLSLGAAVVETVRNYDLSSTDFAPSDPTVDMLYLIEAKSVALDESKRLNARLEGARVAAQEQALTDMLTGLSNRRAMDIKLAQLIDDRKSFGLMHLDLDYFKQVNDTYGHGAGDHVLQQVAHVLSDEVRTGDMVARVGGDEFVLILQGKMDVGILNHVSARLIKKLEQPMFYDGICCRISASIGISVSSFYDKPNISKMLNDADKALYQSKENGRACHTVFMPPNKAKA